MNDKKARASYYFHHPLFRDNCAQAVVRVWHQQAGESDELITAMRRSGGGCAPEGYCGALYGALQVTDETLRKALVDDFTAVTGSCFCRELRHSKKMNCRDRVQLADQLVKEICEYE